MKTLVLKEVPFEFGCGDCFFLKFRQNGDSPNKTCMMINTCSKYVRPDHTNIIYKEDVNKY